MSNPFRRVPGVLALGLAALATGCGGGGGGGSAGPALLFVTFDGATATPTAGDRLLLVFDAPVEIASGTNLDDEDLEFSDPSATLGLLTNPATVVAGQTVQLFLGNGVSFTPGTTRVAFSELADAVVGQNGARAVSTGEVTITNGDNEDPFIQNLTLNGIDDQLNGDGPAMGTLQVPRSGFTIDLTFIDSNPIASDLIVSADGAVATGAGTRQADENFGDQLQITFASGTVSALLPSSVRLPSGEVTLTARVVDLSGRVSAPLSFSFRTIDATNDVRPFESEQLWFLDTSRDIEAFTAVSPGGNVGTLTIQSGANGVPDFDDALEAIGLRSSVSTSVSEAVRSRLLQTVVDELNSLYDGVSIRFTTTQPSTPFPSTGSPTFGSFPYSQICLGGAPTSTGSGTLGAAIVDPNNGRHEDNCEDEFQTSSGPIRLGVFLHTLVDLGFLSGPGSEFRTTFDPFTPIFSGQPIGEVAGDASRVSGTMTDARSAQIDTAIANLGRAVAVVTAHECGHSMGLVVNGAMPVGLYGGDSVNFPLSPGQPPSNASNHIENQSLFPSGSQNVMSPAIDFASALSPNTGFNTLNRAYLREQALYDPR